MRTVYVDVFFFINMFVNYLLLLFTKRIIHSPVKYKRIIIGALSGAVFSFAAFLPFNHLPINIFINIASVAFISLITFGYKNKTRFIKTTVILITITFLFSGAIIAFYNAFKPDGMVIINNAVYFNISPILLIILSLIIYFLLFVIKKIFKNNASSNLVHNLKIYFSDNEYRVKCKTDSGCNVKEPFSGSSVIIIDKNSIDIPELSPRYIPFNSLGGNGMLKGYKADEVFIDDKKIDEEVYIGICEDIFKSEIKGLIPVNLLED